MSHIENFVQMLKDQKPQGIQSGDWVQVEFEAVNDKIGTIVLLPIQKMGFTFDKQGQFKGIFPCEYPENFTKTL